MYSNKEEVIGDVEVGKDSCSTKMLTRPGRWEKCISRENNRGRGRSQSILLSNVV